MNINKTVWLLVAVCALWCVCLPRAAKADDLRLLELDAFSMDFAKIKNYRDGYFQYADPDKPGEHWDTSSSANFDLHLIQWGDWGIYSRNTVHGETTNRQYRRVGWKFEDGVELGPKVRVWLRHHSQHALDSARDQHFPLENEIGISLSFYERNKDTK